MKTPVLPVFLNRFILKVLALYITRVTPVYPANANFGKIVRLKPADFRAWAFSKGRVCNKRRSLKKLMFRHRFMIALVLSLSPISIVAVAQDASSAQAQDAPAQKKPCKYDLDGRIVGDPSQCAPNTNIPKIPAGEIIVKGAWASASDSTTPVPEGGKITEGVYNNEYFGLSYPFSANWYQKSAGPPPSETGLYVLAQLRPSENFKGPAKGTILVTAQDLFFTLAPAANTAELINFTRDHLREEQKPEHQPKEVKIADHPFIRFDYVAPVIPLHTYVLATEIRCHAVEFILGSREPALLEGLIQDINKMKIAAGGDVPVCIKNYADDENNVVEKVDPVFTVRRFNAVPVRIIIDKQGKVKHIHFLSAFPEQSKAITDAVMQWKFKPYMRDGKPVEVETGIMFGNVPPALKQASPQAQKGGNTTN
jgi:hypothetical protein